MARGNDDYQSDTGSCDDDSDTDSDSDDCHTHRYRHRHMSACRQGEKGAGKKSSKSPGAKPKVSRRSRQEVETLDCTTDVQGTRTTQR